VLKIKIRTTISSPQNTKNQYNTFFINKKQSRISIDTIKAFCFAYIKKSLPQIQKIAEVISVFK
jgi:hypothetical protein